MEGNQKENQGQDQDWIFEKDYEETRKERCDSEGQTGKDT